MREVSDQPSKDFQPRILDQRLIFDRIGRALPGTCRLCRASTADLLCSGCLADLAPARTPSRTFSGCVVTGAYEYGPPLNGLIGLGKYGRHRGICRLLGALVASTLPRPCSDPVVLVPIPMPWPRLIWRGYNHAEEIALTLGDLSGCPVDRSLLVRRGWQAPQRGLSRDLRQRNLRSAFKIAFEIRDLMVVLVDDVCTTGATMGSAATALLDAGAAGVSGVVVAHRSSENR